MIKKGTINDIDMITSLALKLWPDNNYNSLKEELLSLMNKNTCFFIKYENNTPIGFSQVSIRNDYVEGTTSSPVGYLEGIFVEEGYRLAGHASALVKISEAWAKSLGCSEFASDCEIDNVDSFLFHIKMGFIEAGRTIHFKKDI